jgi:hypothetical protein
LLSQFVISSLKRNNMKISGGFLCVFGVIFGTISFIFICTSINLSNSNSGTYISSESQGFTDLSMILAIVFLILCFISCFLGIKMMKRTIEHEQDE